MAFFVRMELKDRIRKRREELGLTQTQLAKMLNLGQSAIGAWEDGRNMPKIPRIKRLAEVLQTSTQWLQYGVTEGVGERVPLRGFVGAGEVITALPDDVVDYVDGPPMAGKPLEALQIKGSSMAPVYRDGDLVFYQKDYRCDPREQIGEECVLELTTGELYLKRVFHGSKPGRFTLMSYNGVQIEDVQIRSCSPVMWVKRHRR